MIDAAHTRPLNKTTDRSINAEGKFMQGLMVGVAFGIGR